MEGVRLRLLFWGFDGKNNDAAEPEAIPGGVIFRNEVYNDPGLLARWQQMQVRINIHTHSDAIEEAAFTWFNRLMAIKILEKNSYEERQLDYEGTVPALLDKARNGIMPFLGDNEKQKVREHLLAGDEETAFGILLTGYCRKHPLLNRVFGGIDDFTELLLPNNLLTKGGIIELLNVNGFVQEEDYKQVELIGWLYQFYISEKKDEVFKGFKENKKARKEDIPAATQIFTPKWIVKYLVENTVGRTWLEQHPDSEIRNHLKYLVENQGEVTKALSPGVPIAIGMGEAKCLTLLDPAVGSGHILVTAFDVFMLIYKEEGSTTRQAVREILKYNLFGLDIDKRAAQLARFAVLMKAASYDRDILNENVLPHIYAMPEPVHFDRKPLEQFLYEGETVQLDKEGILKDLNKGLLLMRQAQNLGSIIQFDLQDDTRKQLKRRYKYWSEKEEKNQLTLDEQTWWKPLSEYLNPLCVLLDQYACVAANPPYMGQKSMNGELKDYVGKYYPITKGDLMTVFMEVIPNLTIDHGRFALINLPSWLFLSSFEEIRSHYLHNYLFESLLHMGRGIFGIDFGSVAFSIKKELPENRSGNYFRLHERNFQHIHFEDIEKLFLYSNNNPTYRYDFNLYRDEDGITEIPKESNVIGLKIFYPNIAQTQFHKIPGGPLAYWVSTKRLNSFLEFPSVLDVAEPKVGMLTTNNDLFMRYHWEVDKRRIGFNFLNKDEAIKAGSKWIPYSKGGSYRKWYGNNVFIVNFENDGKTICDYIDNQPGVTVKSSGRVTNRAYFYKPAITWSLTSSGSFGVRYRPQGFIFDIAGMSIFSDNKNNLINLAALLNSNVAFGYLNLLNPTLSFQKGDLEKIPTKLPKDEPTLAEYCIQISKKDWDSAEYSWDFTKSRLLNDSISLKEAYKKWLVQVTEDFFVLHANEEKLNRIFIDIYGMQDELTLDVPLKDISILQEELDRNALEQLDPTFRAQSKDTIDLPVDKAEVISQFISYAIGLLMGRYRLDKPGFNIAHPDPTSEELSSYQYNGHQFTIDEDAIIPLFGEDSPFADNVVKRFKDVLVTVWGEATQTENINFLNECLGMSFEKFLTEKLWDYHKKVYQKKPIYWLFTSLAGSFKVLVYMHRMDKFTVQKIRLNYLHRYMEYLSNEVQQAEANGTATRTIDRLNKALQDCREYDKILKPLADQQIVFDLDDGVTVNYAKFKPAVAPLK